MSKYRIISNTCKFRIEWYNEFNLRINKEAGEVTKGIIFKKTYTPFYTMEHTNEPTWEPLASSEFYYMCHKSKHIGSFYMEEIKAASLDDWGGVYYMMLCSTVLEFNTIDKTRWALTQINNIDKERKRLDEKKAKEKARQEWCAKQPWEIIEEEDE